MKTTALQTLEAAKTTVAASLAKSTINPLQLAAMPHQQNPLQQVANTNNPLRQKENRTGMPDGLKAGVENLSGLPMDDVKVHYNSDKPAQMQALGYAQGTEIHVGPGQEQHLPHEAWHVVQQKQGRVKPTVQMKTGVQVNDDKGLEKEADELGKQALQMKTSASSSLVNTNRRMDTPRQTVQLNGDDKKKEKESFFQDSFDSYSAIRGSGMGPLNQGPRSDLDTAIRTYPPSELKFFPRQLDNINKQLGVNTSAVLPPDKRDKYVDDLHAVQSGEMSNSKAFFRSGVDWFKRGNFSGSALNFLGMFGGLGADGRKAYEESQKEKLNRITGK